MMRVELVATKSFEKVVVDSAPTLIREDRDGANYSDNPIKGSCHCLISREDERLVVWDLGTETGTFVNGVRVQKASLRVGDTLRLGDSEFAVRNEEPKTRRYLYGPRT